MITSKFWLWIISLFTAIILWKVVQIQETPEAHTFIVPVEIKLPADLVVVNSAEMKVNLKVTGPQDEVAKLRDYDLKPYVPYSVASRLGLGLHKDVPIKLDREAVDANLHGLTWDKGTVDIKIDKLVSRDLPVDLEVLGGTRFTNYVFDQNSSLMNPEQVTVRIPKTQQKRVMRARVTLDLSTIERGKKEELDVELLDADDVVINDLTPSPSHVEVVPALAPAPQSKMVLVQARFGEDRPEIGFEVWRVQVIPSQVAITGPSEQLARITTLDTLPISLKGLNDTATVAARLKMPRGVRLERPAPVKVMINIRPSSPAVSKPSISLGADPQNPQP